MSLIEDLAKVGGVELAAVVMSSLLFFDRFERVKLGSDGGRRRPTGMIQNHERPTFTMLEEEYETR